LISNSRNLGFAAGNNIALRLVTATEQPAFVWLVNNDMVVDAQALSAMVATLETGNGVAAVGGVILDYTDRDLVQSIGGGRMTKLGMGRVFGAGLRRGGITPPPALDYISGGHLLTRTETIREVGLLDERYFLYAEDADWGARMRERGYELACALDAFVWHKGSITIVARSPFQDYHITRSHLSYVRRNAPLLLPVAATYSLIRFLAPKVIRGEWQRARAVIAAYRDHIARAVPQFSEGPRRSPPAIDKA
jgi:GT2 family glycosyltransferase